MEKIALVVTIEYKTESKSVFLQALFDHQHRSLKTERGTLQFEILQPNDSSNTVVIFELYANADALKIHDSGTSLALFREQAGSFISKASAQSCSVIQP
jgi:quinol monooxygenase YgiN